ncbi:U3 small nucleolar RNA-associated protein 18 homolog [Anthonomus grandis grandis]|uniref:U3 small nucleolar RNA-associated protein 18 homolog n=1 Tax=Anthonomus grandis grandis TaxID=2921223 RepID=UPI002164F5F5|nr:U3 small nucleolar RNA-associated protein 18 homolog [Anthonomus grandis grandis]
MPKQPRKRKIKPSSSNELGSPTDGLNPPKEKIHVRDDSEMDELSRVLFGDSSAFLRSLEEAEEEDCVAGPSNHSQSLLHRDSGVESSNSEDSDNCNRKPAWFDDDDEGIEVGEALDAQGRKLPRGGLNERDKKYSNLLKHKFESVVGCPSWAKLKRPRTESAGSDEEILRTVGFVTKAPQTSLLSGSLEFKKVKDLNCETYNEGPFINAVEFHPSSSVGLVAGNQGIASLFAVDGKKNNKLHSVVFQNFPILCAKFIRSGNEVILGSRQKHIFSYDLLAAKPTRYNLPPSMTQCKKFVVSPDTQFFAAAGKWGEVHILSSISKEKIATLKQDSEVTSLEFNYDGSMLFGHSDTGEVTVWNMKTRKVQHKFMDEGCLQGTTLAASSSNQFLACGSAQGVVNLYAMEDVLHNKVPKPRKTIMNLTTAITNLKFNSTSELLALSSTEIKNSIKLLHLGSSTVFSNFPPFDSKLGNINCVNFTPGSGFLALANRKSIVSLFRLKHFKNY